MAFERPHRSSPRAADSRRLRASYVPLHPRQHHGAWKLLPRLGPQVSAWVVVARPVDEPDWDEAALWDRAASIPRVRVFRDDDGVEAERFHAATSGLTLLYDATGRLRFAGGITEQRGHEGDNFGTRRIESLVKTGTADRADSPVFGCTLLNTSMPASN